jgi:hypothetical protein
MIDDLSGEEGVVELQAMRPGDWPAVRAIYAFGNGSAGWTAAGGMYCCWSAAAPSLPTALDTID